MESERSKPEIYARERLAREAKREGALLQNILWITLWTLVALIPSMIFLIVPMPLVGRVITFIVATLFWLLSLRCMYRLTGLLDEGKRPISLNTSHAGEEAESGSQKLQK